MNMERTMMFKVEKEEKPDAKQILEQVYSSLKEKGYNPINQLVGYLLSGDPAYVTSYNNARNLIRKLERDELLEELLRSYLDENES
ncbi:MAG: hypothetical protein JG764_1677 [Clostridiales bacterium]|nr:hypothetical protein [Clostridiales bacterium]